jgi:hypothetical protein
VRLFGFRKTNEFIVQVHVFTCTMIPGGNLRLADSVATIASVAVADIGTCHGGNYKTVQEEDCQADCE